MRMVKGVWGVAAAVAMIGATGCGDDSKGSGSGSEFSSTEFQLSVDPDFHGNSVFLCGHREKEADSKYPCDNKLEIDDAYPDDGCGCFNFDENGKLIEYDRYTYAVRPVEFENLCPSNNVEEAKWLFEFTIFSDKNCYGDPLNGYEDNNFACFASDDISKQDYPNAALEWLEPGKNKNEVICITKNAEKEFDFDVCVDESDKHSYDSNYSDKLVLDCGCQEVYDSYNNKTCECDQGIYGLPDNCWIDGDLECKIVCQEPYYPPAPPR